jgi:hypothetical protein
VCTEDLPEGREKQSISALIVIKRDKLFTLRQGIVLWVDQPAFTLAVADVLLEVSLILLEPAPVEDVASDFGVQQIRRREVKVVPIFAEESHSQSRCKEKNGKEDA